MERRKFLQLSGLGLLASCKAGNLGGWQNAYHQLVLVSGLGCGRATGYAEANKIVSFKNKTHITWLDSLPEGFRVQVSTLDRKTSTWSPTYTIGHAFDNHGGAALATDSRGYLHIVYYPHHHEMRYRRSRFPNDASQWEEEILFGQSCTYPTLVCGPDDTLYFTCRRKYQDTPWQVELWAKPVGKPWSRLSSILQARYPGYAHFQESLAWSADQKTIYLGCRIHEKTDASGYGQLQSVGFMLSKDYGRSWQKSDGTPIQLPATADNIELLETGGLEKNKILRAGGMATDLSGQPHLLFSIQENGRGQTILASPQAAGRWKRMLLNPYLPDEYKDWDMIMPGGISFNQRDEVFVVSQIQKPKADESSWGHASNEVILLHAPPGGNTFKSRLISTPDTRTSNWLPNIERSTGHNTIEKEPGILFTSGSPGEGLSDLLTNKVFFTK